MGIFDKLFRKRSKTNEYKPIPEQDEVSGYEPIPRYPNSVMISHAGEKEKYYIEYESMDDFGTVAKWFKNQLKTRGWKATSWSPPHFIDKGSIEGTTGFITVDYKKEGKNCTIGTKYRPRHSKIWIDYQ